MERPGTIRVSYRLSKTGISKSGKGSCPADGLVAELLELAVETFTYGEELLVEPVAVDIVRKLAKKAGLL